MKFVRTKIIRISVLVMLLVLAMTAVIYFQFTPTKPDDIRWGLSYSPGQAAYLGLDPKATYASMLEDLHPGAIRLMAYWSEVEPEQGVYDFTMLDWMVEQAHTYNAKVLLVVGRKQPRWPECHEPGWLEKLSQDGQHEALLTTIKATVEHYRTVSAVSGWQVENEPFFDYGQNCPTIPYDTLQDEITAVREVDTTRPVVVTDSGEKGSWFAAGRLADVFGATMYRRVYHTGYKRYIRYPIPPAFYRFHAGLLRLVTGQKTVIGVELQAEPWFETNVFQTPVERQKQLMNPEIFAENVEYANKVGFHVNYLWGVEWWYWLQAKQNDPSMVNSAKKLFEQYYVRTF